MRLPILRFNRHSFSSAALVAFVFFLFAAPAQAGNTKLTIAIPGPGNLLFLPIELAKKINADVAEGADLDIRFFGGGPQAYQDMLGRNSDFSAGGMAALAQQRASGQPVICIAPISRVPAYSLMVRSNLKSKIKKIADLKGRVIGVKGHTKGGRSTTQMFTEYQLKLAGVPIDSVNFIPTGQSYEDQHAALASGTVDAIMGDEPFVSRMQKDGTGFYLADFHDTNTVKKLMGGLFLNSQIATREDFIAAHPDSTMKMVKVIKRTLVWISHHSPQEIVNALNLPEQAEREALLNVLARYKNMYSPDGSFSNEQLRTSEEFFHQVSKEDSQAQALSFNSFIVDKWAGRTR